MRTISLRLDAEADAMLRGLCERLDVTQTEVVRRALALLASSAAPTPGSLGLELGLVGAFSSGGHGSAEAHSEGVKARLVAKRGDEQRSDEPAPPGNTTRPDGTPRNRRPRRPTP